MISITTMDDEMVLFVIPEKGVPVEFPLSYLLYTNFAYHDSKKENIRDLNEFIKAIEEFRDSLMASNWCMVPI